MLIARSAVWIVSWLPAALIFGAADLFGATFNLIGIGIDLALRLLAPAFVASNFVLRQYARQLAILGLLFVFAIAWGYVDKGHQTKGFLATNARATTPALYDSRHHFIGILSTPDRARDSASAFALYSSIPSPRSPGPMFACLRHLEDRRLGTWPTAVGFDPISSAETLLAMSVGRGGGHSGLVNQLARTMHGETPSAKEAPLEKFGRKFGEWRASPALTGLLRADDVVAAQFVTANLPLLAGAPGSHAGELPHGVEAAALIVFGTTASELPPDEQYLLAAADFRPVLLAPSDNPKALRWSDARWRLLQARASRCLLLLGTSGTPGYDHARLHLLALAPPRIGRQPEDTSNGLVMDFASAVNPVRRARIYLGAGGLNAVAYEMQLRVPPVTGPVAAVDLALDANKNSSFARRIEVALEHLQVRAGSRVALRLTGPDEGNDRAQVIVALASLDGRILRFYQAGPSDGFDAARPVASIAKALVAAPVLGRYDHGDSLYCDRHIAGLHDPGRATGAASCTAKDAWVSARTAYARSLTQAFVNRLRTIPPAVLRREAGVLGLTLPNGVSPWTSVPLGLVEASPRTMLQAMAAIGRVLAGATGDISSPSLIFGTEATAGDASLTTFGSSGRDLAWIAVQHEIEPSSSYLRDVLAAPLGTGGTLAALARFQASHNPAFKFHIAKSGTSSTPSGLTRDAMIAGAFELSDGRAFAYFVLAGTPDPARPLGNISGGSLAPLVRIILEEALKGAHDE